jgi:hypothetical protein
MRKIAQPYCVWWDHSSTDEPINQWCLDNLEGHYYFLSGGSLSLYQVDSLSTVKEDNIGKEIMLCMFECPKDAMMFKLTWVGQ